MDLAHGEAAMPLSSCNLGWCGMGSLSALPSALPAGRQELLEHRPVDRAQQGDVSSWCSSAGLSSS